MVIGLLRLILRLPEAQSLKEKRWQIKSLTTRIRNKFNVSVAEVDGQDSWQRCTLAVVHVGNDRRHSNELLDHVRNLVEAAKQLELLDSELEFF